MNGCFHEDVGHKKGSSVSSCLSSNLSIFLRTLSLVLFLCVLNKSLSQVLFIENCLYIDQKNGFGFPAVTAGCCNRSGLSDLNQRLRLFNCVKLMFNRNRPF